jgi:hypothetical protein
MKNIGEIASETAEHKATVCGSPRLRRICFLGVAASSTWFAAPRVVFAQTPPPQTESDSVATPDKGAESPEGLWPSPRLMRLMLARWAEEASRQYDLDDEQRAKVREATVDRWSKFIDENREAMQPLANEFVEMRMELKPPPKERVQEWAKRAGPVFDKVRTQLDEGADEFRKVLRPVQRAKFEIDALQMKVGLQIAEQRIKQWQSGEFKPDEFWEPLPSDRESRRAEKRRNREEREAKSAYASESSESDAKDAAADQIAVELDTWDRYVAEFIRSYGLDAGQRTTVLSCLSELKERAVAHRDRHHEEIDQLEKRVASNAGTEAELADINKQLVELYGPIDDMFKELRSRIEQVPTAEQRAAAAAHTPNRKPERASSEDRVPTGERDRIKPGKSAGVGTEPEQSRNEKEDKNPDAPPAP